jgi:glutamate-1-semialdehyde 2,1-aminomutase
MPIGAIGGKKEIMERLAPTGDIYQAGTLSGNPLAMSAGATTLNILRARSDSFTSLVNKTNRLCQEMEKLFAAKGISVCINRCHSMFTIFFQEGHVYDLTTAQKSNTALFARFFHGMLKNGVWLAPSQYEAVFLSFAHSDADISFTLNACSKTLKNL